MKFNLEKTNLFMVFCIRGINYVNKDFIFLYSDEKGIEHLENVLKNNNVLGGFLTVNEILKKMVADISEQFGYETYTGIGSSEWFGRKVLISENKMLEFSVKFNLWKQHLNLLLGENNLYEINIPAEDYKQYEKLMQESHFSERNLMLTDFLSSYELQQKLTSSLQQKKQGSRKNKL